MAPIKMYTMPISQPARAVAWACLYEGTEVEEIQVMPGKDNKKPEYQARHAIATIPQMDDNGFVLSESHAIMFYLGEKFNWSLYPNDLKVRARIQEYFNWHWSNSRKITVGLFAPVMRPDLNIGEEFTKAQKKALTMEQGGVLPTLERLLGSQKFLCADVPTVADLALYCEIGQGMDNFLGLFTLSGINMDNYPKIVAWTKECEKLKGFEESHAALAKMAPMIKKKASQMANKSKL